jgi:hypothetical protein
MTLYLTLAIAWLLCAAYVWREYWLAPVREDFD